jgi:hypothetical protein
MLWITCFYSLVGMICMYYRQASAELQAIFEEELSRCSLAAQQELGGELKRVYIFENLPHPLPGGMGGG